MRIAGAGTGASVRMCVGVRMCMGVCMCVGVCGCVWVCAHVHMYACAWACVRDVYGRVRVHGRVRKRHPTDLSQATQHAVDM